MDCKRVAFRFLIAFAAALASLPRADASGAQKHGKAVSLPAASPSPVPGIDVERIDGNLVYFSSPSGVATPPPLKIELFDIKYLGALRSSDPAVPPYFLFSAKPCQSCLEDSGIYAFPPAGGHPAAYVFPGKILEPKTRALLLESRSFWGRCLRGHGDVYVVFQKERIDRRRQMQPSVEVAEPGLQHMNEQLVERRVPRLSDTLALVKRRQCHEIEGRNRLMLTKPLNRSRRGDELEGEEQDDTPKENQTDEDLTPDE